MALITLFTGYKPYLLHETWFSTNYGLLSIFGLILISLIGSFFYIRNRYCKHRLDRSGLEQHALLRLISTYVETAIAVIDNDNRIKFVNKKFIETFGRPEGGYSGLLIYESGLPESFLECVASEGTEFQYGQNGTLENLQLWINPISVNHKKDYSIGKLLLIGTEMNLLGINQLNPGKLSHEDLSHNLKTPLNSIMGYSQLLLGDNTISERQKEYLSTISENSHRLLDHIKLLLNEHFEENETAKPVFINNGNNKIEKILIVDDVKINRTFLRVMLERKGYTIIEAQNGKEAIDLIKLNSPDLILMDIMMPVMDGIEAIEMIRASNEYYANIPVIAVTAKGKKDNMKSILNAGFNAYLEKPFKEHDLISLIAS